MDSLQEMHMEQIRVATEKFVNNWSRMNNKSTLVHINMKPEFGGEVKANLVDEDSLNGVMVSVRGRTTLFVDWLKAVKEALTRLYDEPILPTTDTKTHLFSIDLLASQSVGTAQNAEPTVGSTVTAKYSFDGDNFSFTKDQLLNLCVDTRAVNAFINELVGRALSKE
jgi:hypothetical protein